MFKADIANNRLKVTSEILPMAFYLMGSLDICKTEECGG